METVNGNDEQKNIRHWLALKFIPRLTIRIKLKLVKVYGLCSIFKLNQQILAEHGLTSEQQQAVLAPDWPRIDKLLSYCQQHQIAIVAFDTPQYPMRLKQITSPPLVLFARGDLALLNRDQLAIVGSRNTSLYGRDNAKNLAAEIARHGLVVTSGLALGVDGFAHQGCLEAGGLTLAVLATGVDVIYPARHRRLAESILASGGLIISEALPGTQAHAGLFPKRNRLISGLSLGVVVVEAAIKSGSLVTAKYALEQNRELFAFPGSVHNPQAAGCHQLIKQGAKLVEQFADVKEEIESQQIMFFSANVVAAEKKSAQGLSDDPLLDSVGYETTPVDIVVSRSKLPIDVVLTRLTILELRGLVTAVPGGYLRQNGS